MKGQCLTGFPMDCFQVYKHPNLVLYKICSLKYCEEKIISRFSDKILSRNIFQAVITMPISRKKYFFLPELFYLYFIKILLLRQLLFYLQGRVSNLQDQCQKQEERHRVLTEELEQLRAATKSVKNSPRNKSHNTSSSTTHNKSGKSTQYI